MMPDVDDAIRALRPVVQELEKLGVRYCVGGSIASSFHGSSRATNDVDLSTEIDEPTAAGLVRTLAKDYYGSEAAAREAVRRRSCFNLVHLPTSYKVDLFVSRGRPFDRSIHDRAVQETLGQLDRLVARVVTPEDIILLKLEWYRLGGETSERQWTDNTIVAKIHRGRLDHSYLQKWADELKVSDLLQRLLTETGA